MFNLDPFALWVRDVYFRFSYKYNLGWKHTKVKDIKELRRTNFYKEVFYISITKNPYSWLLSLYRRPYHQYYTRELSFEEFLSTPWKCVDRDGCGKVLKSPIELWNLKNCSYLNLKYFDGLNIRFESILKDPENIVKVISNHFSIPYMSASFINYNQSTKGEKKNFQDYQDYYISEKWKDEFSKKIFIRINKEIDRDLMACFSYEIIESEI